MADAALLERVLNDLFRVHPGQAVDEAGPVRSELASADRSAAGWTPVALPSGLEETGAAVPLHRTGDIAVDQPGDAELRELGQSFAASARAAPAPPQLSLATSVPSYYFLNDARESHSSATRTHPTAAPVPMFDVQHVRRDFPILRERVNGRPLVWLDNAATTQKPQAVLDRIDTFYRHENSNIHRAAHQMAARATDAYEAGRETARCFLGAQSTDEIVFVRGATEGINLVAQSWGRANLTQGDEVIVSWLEHHANIVPWQRLVQERGAQLRVIPVDDEGQVSLEAYARLLGPRTKIVSVTHVSNALGTVTPIRQIVDMAHAVGARVLVDGAQAVSHLPVNVRALDADWYVFSGHKVFGPTGIGVLYGKQAVLEAMPPWQGGGNMIRDVTFEHTEYQTAPARFEAGTGNIADVAGLDAALQYVLRIGLPAISQHLHQLLEYATRLLVSIPRLRLIGTAAGKAGVLSLVIDGHRTEDIGAALDREGIAVRSGHHCAQPILRRFGVETTVRPSLALYNTFEDIDRLSAVLTRIASRKVSGRF